MTMRARQVLIAIDQLANTLAGGWADETLSARAWRLGYRRPWSVTRRVIDAAFFWQRDHCMCSYRSERERLQLPPEYRDQVVSGSGIGDQGSVVRRQEND